MQSFKAAPFVILEKAFLPLPRLSKQGLEKPELRSTTHLPNLKSRRFTKNAKIPPQALRRDIIIEQHL